MDRGVVTPRSPLEEHPALLWLWLWLWAGCVRGSRHGWWVARTSPILHPDEAALLPKASPHISTNRSAMRNWTRWNGSVGSSVIRIANSVAGPGKPRVPIGELVMATVGRTEPPRRTYSVPETASVDRRPNRKLPFAELAQMAPWSALADASKPRGYHLSEDTGGGPGNTRLLQQQLRIDRRTHSRTLGAIEGHDPSATEGHAARSHDLGTGRNGRKRQEQDARGSSSKHRLVGFGCGSPGEGPPAARHDARIRRIVRVDRSAPQSGPPSP